MFWGNDVELNRKVPSSLDGFVKRSLNLGPAMVLLPLSSLCTAAASVITVVSGGAPVIKIRLWVVGARCAPFFYAVSISPKLVGVWVPAKWNVASSCLLPSWSLSLIGSGAEPVLSSHPSSSSKPGLRSSNAFLRRRRGLQVPSLTGWSLLFSWRNTEKSAAGENYVACFLMLQTEKTLAWLLTCFCF